MSAPPMISNTSSCDGWVDFSSMALASDNPAWPGTAWANRLNSSGRTSKNTAYWRSAAMTARYRRHRMAN